MPDNDDPYVDPGQLSKANLRHDEELARMGITAQAHVRSGRNRSLMIVRGPLTDRQIANYDRLGFYSPEFKAARKALQAKKTHPGSNFSERDGRLIYSPN